jgi:hypothetical protein
MPAGDRKYSYVQLGGEQARQASSGGQGAELMGVLTNQLDVRPGTHEFFQIEQDAIWQGQPLADLFVNQLNATLIDEQAYNKAPNFKKKTIDVDDLGGQTGSTM